MPCQTPYRGDTSQMLLFKIASCIAEGGGGGGAGVASFNARTGAVTLTSGDVTTALGFTPISQADGDARYVLKSGDTMTGALTIGNGVLVASAPALNLNQTWNNGAVTFTGLLANYTATAAGTNSNFFNFQSGGVDRFNFTIGGVLRAVRHDQTNSGLTFFMRKRGNSVSADGAVAADSAIASLGFSAWDGSTFSTGAQIDGVAAEAWTGTNRGSRINIYTTPVGSASSQIVFRLDSTGQALTLDGTAALPAMSFQSDADTGMYRIGANNFGLSAGGVLTLGIATTGVNLTSGLAYQYNSVNVIRAQTASDNYFFGPSGNLTMTGVQNTSVGFNALIANTTGNNNSAFGQRALIGNTTGSNNSGFGFVSLFSNTTGINNMAVGSLALFANTSGGNNTAVGYQSLTANTTATNNVGIGASTLLLNTTGASNVAIGSLTLSDLTTPATGQNTAIGYNTGRGITTGNNNTIIGANVTGLAAGLSNNIIIADGAGNQRINVDSSGFVGIGTPTPLTKTDIIGANIVNDGILTVRTNNAQAIDIGGSIALGGYTDNGASITNVFATIAGRKFSSASTGRSGYFAIQVNNAGTLTERLRITDVGVVTIPTALLLSTAAPLSMASGANQRAGNAVLVGGTVTVANTTVTANTVVILTRKTAGGTPGTSFTYTLSAGASFTITSNNALDTSTVSYLLIEVP